MSMPSVIIKGLGILFVVGLFWLALGLWHRAPQPSPAALWLSGPEAAVLIRTLGKNKNKSSDLNLNSNVGYAQSSDFFFPPVRGGNEGLWDGLGILYPIEPLQLIYAPARGEILFNRFVSDVGHVLMIRHNNQDISVITGIAQPPFKEGATVAGNQILGVPEPKAKTIFYMLRRHGKGVDPRKMFDTVDSPL